MAPPPPRKCTTRYKRNITDLDIFGPHDDVNNAKRSGANKKTNKNSKNSKASKRGKVAGDVEESESEVEEIVPPATDCKDALVPITRNETQDMVRQLSIISVALLKSSGLILGTKPTELFEQKPKPTIQELLKIRNAVGMGSIAPDQAVNMGLSISDAVEAANHRMKTKNNMRIQMRNDQTTSAQQPLGMAPHPRKPPSRQNRLDTILANSYSNNYSMNMTQGHQASDGHQVSHLPRQQNQLYQNHRPVTATASQPDDEEIIDV